MTQAGKSMRGKFSNKKPFITKLCYTSAMQVTWRAQEVVSVPDQVLSAAGVDAERPSLQWRRNRNGPLLFLLSGRAIPRHDYPAFGHHLLILLIESFASSLA